MSIYRKVTATLIIKVSAEFSDDECNEDTLRYCVEEDLEDAGGYKVIDIQVLRD